MNSSRKPNIIVFFTDQQRWDALGLNGCPLGLTPNLDRLARQGTFFKEASTPQPVCGPARSCLQTGQYATTTGVWRNGPGLKKEANTLAGCLREGGYRTGYIGKWHLSEAGHEAVPEEDRGGYQDWLAANVVELTSGPYSLQLWNERNEAVQLPGYWVDAQTDAASRYVHDRSKVPDEPYLLFLSFLEPHHQNTDDSYPAPNGMEEENFSQFGDGGMSPGRILRTSRWKYAVQAAEEYRKSGSAPEYTETHLYDLRTDPYELANLVGQPAHESLRARLRERFLARMMDIGEESAQILPAESRRGFSQRTVNYPNERGAL